tara:strand:- start:305 stop:571 length:267 start_codon:yes stop_codon:yes gene_type:complete
MKEQDLIDLGFERTDVSEIESGGDPFHYYTLDFTTGFSLISQASDEVIDNEWVVEIFNTEDKIGFVDKNELEQFINIVKRNTDVIETT